MTHPLVELAEAVRDADGYGLEWRERPFGRGAEIRVYVPDDDAARYVVRLAVGLGFADVDVMGHLDSPGATSYSGWQIVATAPFSMLADILPALDAARGMIPAARPELTP